MQLNGLLYGWPAAGFVDSRLSPDGAGLERHWAEIAQLRMAATRVVEALDVVERVGPGVITGAVDLAGCPLGLQRGKEAPIAELSQTLPARLIEQVMPLSARNL